MSQVTDPVMLDTTGQDIVAKLQDVIDAINGGTIDPLTVTQNGTYTPSGTTLGYGPVTVNVGGGGGITILSGTNAPTAAQGNNGQIYLRYMYGEVPAGYTKRTYLEFVQGAYINTGLVPSNHSIELYANDMVYGNGKFWFGTNAGSLVMHFTTYNDKYFWGLNGSEGNGGSWSAGDHLLYFNYGSANQIILDGTQIGSGFSKADSNLLLGNRGGVANATNFRLYYVHIRDKLSEALVRYMLPVTRDSDDAAGMYDVVTGTFYPNAGSGTFIPGEVDPSTQILSEIYATYAKVNGAWQNLIGTDINDITLGS